VTDLITRTCHASPLQIPYFNAPIYLENKSQVGKVEEILGPINSVVGSSGMRFQQVVGFPWSPDSHKGHAAPDSQCVS
jgi:hypothetical protein